MTKACPDLPMMELANVIVEVIVMMSIGKNDPREELITEGALRPHHTLKHFFLKRYIYSEFCNSSCEL